MEIILSHSYKGGSGKTTLSANMAKTLALQGKVLLIEADFKMPSLNHLFPRIAPDLFFNDYLNGTHSLDQTIYSLQMDKTQFDVIFVGNKFIPSEKIHSSDRTWFLKMRDTLNSDLKKQGYDYVIFDLAPGISFFTLTILTISDVVISVLRPDYQSFKGMEFLLENFYKRAISTLAVKFHLIFNQVPDHPKMHGLIDVWTTTLQAKFPHISSINRIEYDTEVAYRSAIQEIFLPSSSKALHELEKLTEKILK